MTPRDGDTCEICGYPGPGHGEFLCEQCAEWQGIAAAAEAAISSNGRRPDDECAEEGRAA